MPRNITITTILDEANKYIIKHMNLLKRNTVGNIEKVVSHIWCI